MVRNLDLIWNDAVIEMEKETGIDLLKESNRVWRKKWVIEVELKKYWFNKYFKELKKQAWLKQEVIFFQWLIVGMTILFVSLLVLEVI